MLGAPFNMAKEYVFCFIYAEYHFWQKEICLELSMLSATFGMAKEYVFFYLSRVPLLTEQLNMCSLIKK